MEGQNIQHSDSKVTEYKTPITSAKTPLRALCYGAPVDGSDKHNPPPIYY